MNRSECTFKLGCSNCSQFFKKKFILTEEYIIKIAQNRFEFHISNNSCSYSNFPLSRKPISQQKQEQ